MTAQTLTLTEFLLARIAEDEAVARAVAPLGHVIDMGGNRLDERWYVSRLRFSSADGAARSEQDVEATAHYARHDPARVLAECEAKRRIVERCSAVDYAMPSTRLAHGILAELALPYADHPDWREEWRP